MQNLNTPPIFDVDELETAQDWFERKGMSAFSSVEHINRFLRKHHFELLRNGNYFLGTQGEPLRVGPDFGKAIIQIMQREANIAGRINMSQGNKALLHTIEQTKELLSCSCSTVYRLVNSSDLTMIKMGRRSLITDESIRAYLDRKVVEAESRTSLDNDPNCIKARAARSKAGVA
jgi:excisionase family DNA binding protein